jgi:DNA-binding MarR family transcriptional regulator
MTRVVDALVRRRLARREDDPDDRRVCRVRITSRGRSIMETIRADLVGEYVEVLRQIPPESRQSVIDAVEGLLRAFQARQACAATVAGGTAKGNSC